MRARGEGEGEKEKRGRTFVGSSCCGIDCMVGKAVREKKKGEQIKSEEQKREVGERGEKEGGTVKLLSRHSGQPNQRGAVIWGTCGTI